VPRPTDLQWWWAAVTGALMLVCGVGGVTWAEQKVPSGPAALLAATVPLWMTLIDAAMLRRSRVGGRTAAGLVLGLIGVAVLIGPSSHALSAVDTASGAVIVGGAMCWSLGSLLSRRCNLPPSPAMTVAVQMVAGGMILLTISSSLREWQDGFALADVSVRSVLALAYLALVGSLVALCAYVWLLRRVSAPAVATYAFVNPAVAVFLGWGLAGESVGPRVLLASMLIVGAVVLIQSTLWRRTEPGGLAPRSLDREGVHLGRPAALRPAVARSPSVVRAVVSDEPSRDSSQSEERLTSDSEWCSDLATAPTGGRESWCHGGTT